MNAGRRNLLLVGALGVVGAAGILPMDGRAGGVFVPPPHADIPSGSGSRQTAVLAGGCFWGVQAVFQHVTGVISAVSGYAGGTAATARYDDVGSGSTGHAEAVLLVFDPRQITFGRLMQIWFAVAHDPTQLNRQGPDRGTQYRSAVFPQDAQQETVARAYIAQLNEARTFGKALATTIESGKAFHVAEAYHQDYLVRHPDEMYIVVHDKPKLEQLKRVFPRDFRPTPVLVRPAG